MGLVTGGKGFIGSRYIQTYGGESFDLKDGQDILDGVPESDTIVHLAADSGVPYSIKHPLSSAETNVNGTLFALEACKKRFIFASSGAVENGNTPYAASKIAGEAYCKAFRETYGLSTIALRFSNVYGPGSDHKTSCIAQMIKDAIKRDVIQVYGSGEQTRDFIFIDDVVDAIHLFSNNQETGVFNICSGSLHSVNEIADIISNLTGARIERIPPRAGDVVHIERRIPSTRCQWGLEDGIRATVDYFYAQ